DLPAPGRRRSGRPARGDWRGPTPVACDRSPARPSRAPPELRRRPRRSRARAPRRSPPRGEEPRDPVEALLDPLDGGRVREPQIALGIGAKGGARRDGDVGRIEDLVGETHGVGRQVAGIRQNVERSGWLGADPEADGPQASDHGPPAFVEDRAEPSAVLTRLTKRGDPRPLHELVGRYEEVTVELLQRA